MSQTKTTRAFRTISEAGDELALQPHVLRFWESKFSQIKPIKRGGGRRFYRPEDIEFIRGIKKLLHDEKHSIKDVQKLIRKKGAARVVELGRSLEKAATEKPVADTDLLPQRIKAAEPSEASSRIRMPILRPRKTSAEETKTQVVPGPPVAAPEPPVAAPRKTVAIPVAPPPEPAGMTETDRLALEEALKGLKALKVKLSSFRQTPEL